MHYLAQIRNNYLIQCFYEHLNSEDAMKIVKKNWLTCGIKISPKSEVLNSLFEVFVINGVVAIYCF